MTLLKLTHLGKQLYQVMMAVVMTTTMTMSLTLRQ